MSVSVRTSSSGSTEINRKALLVSMRPIFHCLSFLINNKSKFQRVSLKQPDIILHRRVILPLIIKNGNRRATEKAEVI